jgi:hypothetical protein
LLWAALGDIITYQGLSGKLQTLNPIFANYYLEITCSFELLRSSIYRRPFFCTQCSHPLKEDEEEWLNPDIVEPERLLPLLKQYPDTEMEAYPVSTVLNRPNNDAPELLIHE